MYCERCKKDTDIIRHLKIKKTINKTFFNGSKDVMVCVPCYNNRPEFYGMYLAETIRND